MAESVIKRQPQCVAFNLEAGDVANYGGTGIYDPIGNTVRIYGYAYSTSNIATSAALAMIPEAYRPSGTIYGACGLCQEDGVFRAYSCSFRSTGKIMQGFSSSTRRVVFFGEYIL